MRRKNKIRFTNESFDYESHLINFQKKYQMDKPLMEVDDAITAAQTIDFPFYLKALIEAHYQYR